MGFILFLSILNESVFTTGQVKSLFLLCFSMESGGFEASILIVCLYIIILKICVDLFF